MQEFHKEGSALWAVCEKQLGLSGLPLVLSTVQKAVGLVKAFLVRRL